MTGKTILLVEDNNKLTRNNRNLLRSLGAKVLAVKTLADARRVLEAPDSGAPNPSAAYPDAAVIDTMLPDGSGLSLLKEIRASAKTRVSSLPVLLLTAKGEADDIVQGLSSGADEYLSKPYDLDVFAARLEALLRRSEIQNQLSTISNSVTIGCLRFDVITNQAFYNDNDLLLSQKEFALLFLLAQNEGKILSPQYLFEKVWKQPLKEKAILKTHIYNLKKKISALAPGIIIETSRGEGYSLVKI